jgi:hypothetical protein
MFFLDANLMQCNYSRQKEILKNAPPHDKRQMRVSKTGHTNHDRQESTGGNTGLGKVAAQCYADTFVVNQSFGSPHQSRKCGMVKIATFAKPETVMGKSKIE